jgi:hypothetical protein
MNPFKAGILFQIILRTENPPPVAGIEWKVKRDKTFSNEMLITAENMADVLVSVDFKALPVDAACALILSEAGGGYTTHGYATIVCGLHGERLIPFYSLQGYANAVHAKFSANKAIMVMADRDRESREIIVFKVSVEEMARFSFEQLWEVTTNTFDLVNQIPAKVKDFSEAIIAASDKAGCYHCRHVHYVQPRDGTWK